MDLSCERTNKLIRNTYTMLSMTLLFSALMSYISLDWAVTGGTFLVGFLVMLGLIFAVMKTKDSDWGLVWLFAFTGLMGALMGPSINHYLSMENGSSIVGLSFGMTACCFLSLSGYALTTRKDFNFMGGFLFTGLIILILAMVANIFLMIPALHLALSSVTVILFSGFILYDTSKMVHGYEKNYIVMTLELYLDIINLFQGLLSLIGFSLGDD